MRLPQGLPRVGQHVDITEVGVSEPAVVVEVTDEGRTLTVETQRGQRVDYRLLQATALYTAKDGSRLSF